MIEHGTHSVLQAFVSAEEQRPSTVALDVVNVRTRRKEAFCNIHVMTGARKIDQNASDRVARTTFCAVVQQHIDSRLTDFSFCKVQQGDTSFD